ncbi:phosphotransferase family protein [Streptomyces candidus]|uniref:Hygromycin-B 7''-O-kinase n=1 Tax=Streptomyces candidus TaxID=67283 RepID=A0A7X0HI31_9ACTN|nr:aminoglycoside phosphotransferase family protein [Streptomyces candidus]MBB6436744.1 hygromycin-B 7''-O-kinase [Streptomyces candidus]GHH51240.1 phosphotransferase [Streptomyces candidus]
MLPEANTQEEWDALVLDEATMRPGVADLATRLGLAGASLTRYAAGSLPVYAVGEDHVLKLFPGVDAADAVVESRVLSHLQGRLPVRTPELHDCGTYENGWRYVLMGRLPGEDLSLAWPRSAEADRQRIVTEAGEALAALHALDPAPLADTLGPGDWNAFLARQRSGAVERQRSRKLPEEWTARIPDFLGCVHLPADPPRVLLHTELMRQHLVVDPQTWQLTGLFDFEPAMIGDPAYDLVAVGLFLTRGEPGLMGRFQKAYGAAFDPRLLLTYALLHVYSNFTWYFRELPEPPEPTWDSVAETWFGTV